LFLVVIMTSQSFRLVTLALTLALLAEGCGSSKPKTQEVTGQGFQFSVPSGWNVTHRGTQVSATSGGDLVEVSVFPLVKPYRPALFTAVSRELKARMDALAVQQHATVEDAGVAAPGGVKSHVWRLTANGHVDEYTFLLNRRTEYQLLCRRPTGGDPAVCRQLAATFALR
jgi:hypothetical protein